MYLDSNKLVLHVVDAIVTDVGLNFHAIEFKKAACTLSISIKEVPIEAHHSIGKVERYYAALRRAYKIIRKEIGAEPKVALAYPRITNQSPPSATTLQRAEAIKKAIEAVRQIHAKKQVKNTLATHNSPDITSTAILPLQSLVWVWREKDGWQGPFRLIANDGLTYTVELPHRPQGEDISEQPI
ncbi:hypothetical protein LX36DRAFT_683915 [Colletotrichum falcatum]|nr:hypothetical protein LX36DRAFT_683915 [Colletotrichum falcatum]